MTTDSLELSVPQSITKSLASAPRLRDTARQGSLSLLDQLVVSGTSFVATLLVGGYAPRELGTYALAFSLLFVAMAVQQALVCLPLTVFAPRLSTEDRAHLAGSTLLHGLAISLLASSLLVTAAIVLWWLSPATDYAVLALVLALALPLVLLREFARRFEFARLRIVRAVVLDGVISVLQLTGLAYLAWREQLTATTAIGWLGVTCAVVSASWLFLSRGCFAFNARRLTIDFQRHFAFGHWALASSLLWLTNAYMLHWWLILGTGQQATATLAACMTLVDLSNPFMIGVSNLVAPRAAHAFHQRGDQGLRRIVGWSTLLVAGCMGLFALLLGMLGTRFMALFFRAELIPPLAVVILLAAAVFCLSLGMPPGEGLSAMERPRGNFLASGAALIATSLVAAFLLGPLGLVGAATAILSGHITATLVRTSLFWWLTSRRWGGEVAQ